MSATSYRCNTSDCPRGDLVNYAGVAGDANPLHWDENIAKLAGQSDVIAHGMLTMGVGAAYASAWTGTPARSPVTLCGCPSPPSCLLPRAQTSSSAAGSSRWTRNPYRRRHRRRKVQWPKDLRPGNVERPLPLTRRPGDGGSRRAERLRSGLLPSTSSPRNERPTANADRPLSSNLGPIKSRQSIVRVCRTMLVQHPARPLTPSRSTNFRRWPAGRSEEYRLRS